VFKAHRIVLQARSDFFKALLNTPMKEGNEQRVRVSAGPQVCTDLFM
jgi:hypothetical protein